jgi:cell division protein FtsZ
MPVHNTNANAAFAEKLEGAQSTVPSVWRNNRTQASERVNALSSGGMEDFEIPAFLRKQAD